MYCYYFEHIWGDSRIEDENLIPILESDLVSMKVVESE